MDLINIKNLVFDLGGVIIDLHINATLDEFSRLSGKKQEEIKGSYFGPDFFHKYEKGLISNGEFKQALSDLLDISVSDDMLERAWNMMLGKINPVRVETLRKLADEYNLLLLSNTNEMHEQAFNDILYQSCSVKTMHEIFHKVYYSHEIHMRKPDEDIFLHVLEDNGIEAHETLFLDDMVENLKTASRLGINTFHVTSPDVWVERINGR